MVSRIFLFIIGNTAISDCYTHLRIGPIVLKGIQTVRDAMKASEANMDGIIVSNRMPIVRRLSSLCSNYHRRRQTSRRMCAFFGLSSSRTSVDLQWIDAILELIVPFDHVKIVEAVGDKLDVMYDSGVRTGSDVIKALALGAKVAYHTSRPYSALTYPCFSP
jgi:lactate 2-monooxygenase